MRVPKKYKSRVMEVIWFIRNRVYPQVKHMEMALKGTMDIDNWGMGIVLQKTYSRRYEDVVYINLEKVKWLQNRGRKKQIIKECVK